MEDPAIFQGVLHPGATGEEHVMKLTAASVSLHALGVSYDVRKDEEVPRDRLETFLKAYVAGPDLQAA